jgi:hypothetical protein
MGVQPSDLVTFPEMMSPKDVDTNKAKPNEIERNGFIKFLL